MELEKEVQVVFAGVKITKPDNYNNSRGVRRIMVITLYHQLTPEMPSCNESLNYWPHPGISTYLEITCR